jgi:molybdopterin molybdotransferase
VISVHEALGAILEAVPVLEGRSVRLHDARGCFLAEEIVSNESLPAFDSAGMDGYAVRHENVAEVPARLRVVGEIPAGTAPVLHVGNGEAVAIATGGMIPAGCSAVVQKEWCEKGDDGFVVVMRRPAAGLNIRKAGTDIGAGSLVLPKGALIGSRETGILAALGILSVSTGGKPAVAICSTGSELAEDGTAPGPAQIRDSNRHLLLALAAETGCTAIDLGIVRDDPSALDAAIAKGLKADALITSGGVSAGEYDLVKGTLHRAGVSLLFHKINIKPGMPMLFGMKDTVPVFGLPGNPVSTFVTWHQFVRPALLRMMGSADPAQKRRLQAVLAEPLSKTDGKRHFIRGILGDLNGEIAVRSTGSQQSNLQTSVLQADCFIILPEETTSVAAGSRVEVELI